MTIKQSARGIIYSVGGCAILAGLYDYGLEPSYVVLGVCVVFGLCAIIGSAAHIKRFL